MMVSYQIVSSRQTEVVWSGSRQMRLPLEPIYLAQPSLMIMQSLSLGSSWIFGIIQTLSIHYPYIPKEIVVSTQNIIQIFTCNDDWIFWTKKVLCS